MMLVSHSLPTRTLRPTAYALLALCISACGDSESNPGPTATATGGVPGSGGVPGAGDVAGTPGAGGLPTTGGTPGAGGTHEMPTECSGNLLPLPDDPSARGPWHVGVRTATIGRTTVEVVYPAEPGSTAGLPEVTYDVRDWLPPQERDKVPDANSPAVGPIGGNLYRDVPIDASNGPFPVVIMIHGTASFRIASGSTAVHWASRGFVVLSADYPGLSLLDQLNTAGECGYPPTGEQDVPADVSAQVQALQAPAGDIAFLAGRIDPNRLGITGHSQGACITATLTTLPGVRIILPMTGSTEVTPSPTLQSIMWIAGIEDTVIGYDSSLYGNFVCPDNPNPPHSNVVAFDAAPGAPAVKKRLVGISGGGHLVMTDLCQDNAQGRNAVEEAEFSGVCGIGQAAIIGLPTIFDCGTIDMATGVRAVNYASTAALEETLHCLDRTAAFANLQTAVPEITDFRSE